MGFMSKCVAWHLATLGYKPDDQESMLLHTGLFRTSLWRRGDE